MSKLTFTLAQINPTVGDIEGNIRLMQQAAITASKAGSDMVIFPELSLTGYHPADMLDEPVFMQKVQQGLDTLIELSKTTANLHWVVGAPTPRAGPGKRLENSLLVIANGLVALTYAKQLLPMYNIFHERRHFEPGPEVSRVLRIGNIRIGFLICEDGWNDDEGEYLINPFKRLADAKPDLIVSINASPSNIGKREQRHQLFAAASLRHQLPLVYLNQIGGHDQLIFDGSSFVVTPKDGVVFETKRFAEDLVTLKFEDDQFGFPDGAPLPPFSYEGLPVMEFYRQQIVLGLQDYARRCGFGKVVIGSSGGIDSALTMALATEALGASNVTGITMPSSFSSAGSVDDSVALCSNLGIELITHPIKDVVSTYKTGFENAFASELKGLSLENLQARVRGAILMEYSNTFGHLVLTTGNKSEISVGYCTLYGDTNGGLGLIGDLYKTEVFELSKHINQVAGREIIPNSIIEKEPSAELAPGQRDTDSLPPYEFLDIILKHLIEGSRLGVEEREPVENSYKAIEKSADGAALIKRIKTMIARNEYKRRQAPPILRLRSRAFGSGRQMPIAAHYDF